MGRKYYDDFVKEPVDKMANSISNMTYCYERTRVPKEHYKKILQKEIVEIMSEDTNIEMNLLRPYLDMISGMKKENEKFFFKALLISEMKLNMNRLSAADINGLDFAWMSHALNGKKSLLSEDIISNFKKGDIQKSDED